ncbi:MAG: cell division protein FtsA [Acidobacteriota bacterium]
MVKSKTQLAGIDVGTTKVTVVIGEIEKEHSVRLTGIGCTPCKGMRKGVLVNLESTCRSLRAAVQKAEAMAGVEIENAFISVAGPHIRSFNSRGGVAISGRDNEVTGEDIHKVLVAARAVSIPQDREIIHVLPQEYTLDGQTGIDEPRGLSGHRLLANVHVVTGAEGTIQNLVTCINRLGIEVIEVILGQLASADLVLTPDERQLGALLIDIGGGTTDVVAYEKNAIWHTSVLPVGGDNFTNDIAVGLRTPIPDAERIKITSGCSASDLVDADEVLEVPSVGGRRGRVLSRRVLCEILEPRAEEIFTLVSEDVKRSGCDRNLKAGAVITGGGSLLDGVTAVAERTLEMPVRRGVPDRVVGLVDVSGNPTFATAAGLLSYGARNGGRPRRNNLATGLLLDVGRRMRDWLGAHF